MFIKIPFESTIEFKTNISEITKMSLEHDFNVNDGVVLGNFYVSGDYRVHEVSVNKEPFKYTLPFTVELRDDIKKDTLEFNIEDFTYEIIEDKKLKVNIEYSLTAELNEENNDLFERVNEDELESELAIIDDFLENDNENEQIEEKETEESIDTKLNEQKEVEEVEEVNEERIGIEEEKTIMDTIKSGDDTFVTYHVHIVKESETIETISALYSVSSSLINEYNNIDNLSIGDKILIPQADE